MSRPGNASRIARVPLFALIVLLAGGSIGSIVMADRARAHTQETMISQARSAVDHTLSSIFSENDLSSMASPSRASALNQQLAVALGASPISDVTLYSPLGTILFDMENSRIGNKLLGERSAIKTAVHGGAVPTIVGSDLTVVLPIPRFGTLGAVMLTMAKGPIDAAGRPWTAAGLIMALAILPALAILWWVGRIAASAGANISFRPKRQPIAPTYGRAVREPLRPQMPVARPAGIAPVITPVSAPAQHGLREEAEARKMAEGRAKAAEERLNVLQEQYRKTLDELHTLRDRAASPVDGDPELEERALRAEGELRLLEGQLRAVTEERDKLESSFREASARATSGESDPRVAAELDRMKAELTGAHAQLEGTQTQLVAARRELAEATAASTSTEEARAERMRELEQDLDAAHVQILSTQEALEHAQADVERTDGRTATLETELATVRAARDQAERDRDATILQSREEAESLQRELQAARSMAGEESEAVRAQVTLARTLQADLEKAQAEARTVRASLAQTQEQLRAAEHAAAETQSLVERDRETIASQERAIVKAKERANAVAGSATAQEAAHAQALAEIEQLKNDITRTEAEAADARESMTVQTERIRELQRQMEVARSEALRLEEASTLAVGQADAARIELDATRKELRALRNEEQRAAMLEDELRAARAELANVAASHRAELVERDADLEERVRRTREDFQSEFAATSEQLEASQTELAELREDLARVRAEAASATEQAEGQTALTAGLVDRTERAERELRAQQLAARKVAVELSEATEANTDLARKLQDLENRRQLELADEEGQLEMDQILHATQERLAGQTERLIETEERAHVAERSVEVLNERLDEALSQLRSMQMSDALRDLRHEGSHQEDPESGEAAETDEVVRLEDRRASTPFLNELTLDAKKSLTQILGITQILKYKKDAKDQAKLVKQLTAYARRLDLTVSDLADADKLARGSVELTIRRTDLEALVQRVVSESDIGADHDVRIVTEPMVCGVDQLRTEQALAGLLRMSADRTANGKSILVTLQHVEGGALISVADPEPSSDASISPVVKRFAEIQGGWTKVETREDGTGSMFRVFLPDGGINAAAAGGDTLQPGADLHIVVDEPGEVGADEGPWNDADQDMLVREIGRLAEPS